MTDDSANGAEVRALYRQLLDAWNSADGDAFGALFSDQGEVIGFDGSDNKGRDAITAEMSRIFADHETGRYVGKVRGVRFLRSDVAVLRSVAGLVPAGQSDIEPKLNAQQTLVAQEIEGTWRVLLYQNTPAQFHGRPEAVETLTNELRRELEISD